MMLLLWTIVFLLILTIIYIIYKHFRKYTLVLKVPGPKRYPILGNILGIITDSDGLHKNLTEWGKKFKPVYLLYMYPFYTFNLTAPEEIEQILSTMTHTTKSEFYEHLHLWLGDGLLTSNGNKWQTHRKLLTSAFHFNILQQFVGIFQKETKNLVDDFAKFAKNNTEINVEPLISQFTLNSINETSMGTQFAENNSSDQEYKNAILKISDIIVYRHVRPWLWNNFIYYYLSFAGQKEKKTIDVLHKYTNNIIQNRKNQSVDKKFSDSYAKRKRMAMLDLLIAAENEGLIDLKEIKDEINTFMFEGHDTTATSICFSLMLFATHKEVQERIVEEINQVFSDPNEEPTIQKLNELKYLERCIKESLRLYPSVSFISRVLDEDLKTSNNLVLPKGSIVSLQIYDLHRNTNIYSDADKFDPDRFLPENVVKRHPFAYIPFSAGPRNCIGQKFAMLEMKTVLIGILRKFILEPIDTPETIKLCRELVLRSENGVRVKLTKRR